MDLPFRLSLAAAVPQPLFNPMPPPPCQWPQYLAELSFEGLGNLLPLCAASPCEHIDDSLLIGPCRGVQLEHPHCPQGG